MPIEVVLPKVDMDMQTGIIIEWKVVDGARVRQGDIVFDIETSKSVMEVESPGSGIIRGLAPITGKPIAVGTPVAWIYDDHEQQAGVHVPAMQTGFAAGDATQVAADRIRAPSPAPADAAPRGEIRATPAARRLAREMSVDLATVRGSGPGGRIVEDDVGALATKPRSASAGIAVSPAAVEQGRLVPFNPIRRRVAERVTESMRTVPQFHLTAHIDMTALRDLQQRIEAEMAPASETTPSLTILIAYIVSRALIAHPQVNASVEGDAMRLHSRVNIGIAIERDGDLMVPVLQDAGTRALRDLIREFGRMRDDAQRGSITPAQMRGATFTLSNLGMYGVDAFTAIINPPECAILAIGRVVDTPVARDGQVVLRSMATFTLSSDHRIVDGVTAARFMSDLRKAIEVPDGVMANALRELTSGPISRI